MSFKINSLYLTDGYKPSHIFMLAPGTTKLYGTWIPRGLKYAPKGITKIVSFGQQLVWKWIHDEFEENFFCKESIKNLIGVDTIDGEHTEESARLFYRQKALQFVKDMSLYLGMEYDGKHFEELWDLGYLPIKVKALPEGIETNPNIPHMTFINTVDGFAWLTLYLETIVSNLAWKPAYAATVAKLYRRTAEEWVVKTDPSNMWLIDYMCHDFSARGLSGPHDMISVGLGHATSFRGSDTLVAIPAARYFYNEPEDEVCINSVNASEHSVSTTKIFTVGEQQMIADWLEIFPTGILSVVSDTFDLWKLITEYLPANKDAIMARDGKLVIRPDSGDPVDIICGTSSTIMHLEKKDKSFEDALGYELRDFDSWYDNPIWGLTEGENPDLLEFRGKYFKYGKEGYHKAVLSKYQEVQWSESINKGVIELLWDIFGGTINEQGYKVLDPHIGAIYGDSINPERQVQIYERLAAKGFAATNIVLGVGSFTYQYQTRDWASMAAKGSWFEIKEEFWASPESLEPGIRTKSYNIYKDPITDDGMKKSLKGLLQVHIDKNNEYVVYQECSKEGEEAGLLQTIYQDGKFFNQTTLAEIRKRLL
jgi:nicotinamide phosphoribosyltransferase